MKTVAAFAFLQAERGISLESQAEVKVVIVAKLDRLTRSLKDLCELLERFECRGVTFGVEHHGGGFAMGAGGDWERTRGRPPPQAEPTCRRFHQSSRQVNVSNSGEGLA